MILDKDSFIGFNPLSTKVKRSWIQGSVVFTLFFPMFFQLQGTVYKFSGMNFDAEGVLEKLPLPISLISTFIGLVFLVRFRQASLSAAVLFAFFLLMLFSTFISSSQASGLALGKLLLLLQFVLPLFALVLGQSYVSPKNVYLRFEAVILYVLVLIVPAEVILTYYVNQGGVLSPDLYFFAIYQHLQYVPVIFVGLYFLALGSLGDKKKTIWLAIALAPFMGLYTMMSISMLAIALGLFCSVVLLVFNNRICKGRFCLIAALIFLVSLCLGLFIVKTAATFEQKFGAVVEDYGLSLNEDYSVPENIKVKSNINQRLDYWVFYLVKITEGPKEFFFGHADRPDKKTIPSAHNYYLE